VYGHVLERLLLFLLLLLLLAPLILPSSVGDRVLDFGLVPHGEFDGFIQLLGARELSNEVGIPLMELRDHRLEIHATTGHRI